jgi:ABC-2 type transport system permease protein
MNKTLVALLQREWLQHRFAWALLMLVPLALAVLPLAFAHIEFEPEMMERAPPDLALLLSFIAIVATTSVLCLILWAVALFMTIGVPRRDHADRSIEYWLSMPVGHAPSLAVPVLVHMVLVPAAALLVGYVSGIVISMLLVGRFVGLGEWLAVPWGGLLPATLAMVGRFLAGLPLVLLWLSPLLLLAMLANAAFKRWGLPVLAVAIGVGGWLLQRVFGIDIVFELLGQVLQQAGQAMAGASGEGMSLKSDTAPDAALGMMLHWAAADLGAALRALASPLFLGCLVVSAALFQALVLWRRHGAGVQGA